MSLGLVLSGGGARGAYEAGVLRYVCGPLARGRGLVFPVVAGTSAGAFNGAFLAASSADPGAGAARLAEIWSRLELGRVVRLGVRTLFRVPSVLLGAKGEVGLFDVSPLASLIQRELPWEGLRAGFSSGRLRALTVSATHLASGRTTVFVERARAVELPGHLAGNAIVQEDRIGVEHLLASAAIPVLFPPVRVHQELYCEGGLRLNTPLSPAIHLGAGKVLVVAVSTSPSGQGEGLPQGRTPGLAFLLGKVLNAFLLDHVVLDLVHLEEINAILRAGCDAYGPGFLRGLERSSAALPRRRVRRPIEALVVRPSVDIGRLAGQYLRKNRLRLEGLVGRSVLGVLDAGEGAEADLASYLLFDSGFTRELVELGSSDAHARRDELEALCFAGGADARVA